MDAPQLQNDSHSEEGVSSSWDCASSIRRRKREQIGEGCREHAIVIGARIELERHVRAGRSELRGVTSVAGG
jgi:hypothetical protein